MQVLWIEDDPQLASAAALTALQAGQLVIFPTDTVYGLLASVASRTAYELIYAVKQRSRDKPLALLLARECELFRSALACLARWPDLQAAFSAGQLTAVLEPARLPTLPPLVGELQAGPVGLRCPDHTLLQDLLQQHGNPVWATSANEAGVEAAADSVQIISWLQESQAQVAATVVSRSPLSGQPSRVVRINASSVEYLR